MNISHQELLSYLDALERGEGQMTRVQVNKGCVLLNQSVDLHSFDQIIHVCQRPSIGMRLYKYGTRSVVGGYEFEDEIVCKYYYPKSFIKAMTYRMMGSRCKRSWCAGLAFQMIGLATPVPLVFGEWYAAKGLLLKQSFLATSKAEGVDLFEWVQLHHDSEVKMKRMAELLKGMFDLMAEYQITHGDLKATNIIVNELHEPTFIDLDAVIFHRKLEAWKAYRLLDRRRFMKNWSKVPQVLSYFKDVLPSS
jgi:tRNA A-37 threonylcarbamoyl transferase component Bud32